MQMLPVHGLILFNGDRFDNWNFRLNSVLKALDLSEVLKIVPSSDRSDYWQKKNNVADFHLKETEVAYDEMIQILESIFSKKGTCSKFYLLKDETQIYEDDVLVLLKAEVLRLEKGDHWRGNNNFSTSSASLASTVTVASDINNLTFVDSNFNEVAENTQQ